MRRVFQTPTLTFYAPLQKEETHRVIRKYRHLKDFFFRLTLTTENLDKMHFGSAKLSRMLEYMIRVLGDGVMIGNN